MFDMVRIITAHDGTRCYAEMAHVAKELAERVGHTLEIIQTTGVKHKKASLMEVVFSEEWVVWMDSDSMLLDNINPLFEQDCDLILSVKEPSNRSNRYGSYVYSGFVCVRNTLAGRAFLKSWQNSPTDQSSDQLNLHRVLDGYLDASVYDQIGTTQTYGDLRVHLLDPNLYYHQQSIHDMTAPADEIKVIHFKGRLHRKWDAYKGFLC